MTTATKRGRERGISYIEMLVVVAIVAIMAALIEPSYAHAVDGIAQKRFPGDLRSEVMKARLKAIQDGQVVELQYDPAGHQITLNEPPVQDQSNQQPQLVTDLQNLQPTQVHALPIPNGISFTDFTVGANDQGAGAWGIHFYPDGTSEGGGAQIQIDKTVQSIVVDTHGSPTIVQGPLPDTNTNVWPVGTYYERQNTQ